MADPRSSLWADPDRDDPRHPWLEAAVVTPPPPAPAPPPPPAPPRRSRLRRAGGLLLVTAVAAIAAVATVAVLDRGQGTEPEQVRGTAKPLAAAPGRTSATRINEIYERVNASVVSVQVRNGGSGGSGTGFVIDSNGTIVTNAHVADGAGANPAVQVRFDDNGESIPARVVGSDPSSDLAVLKVDPADAPTLVALPLADSDEVKVGDAAIAIGFPLGLDKTATAGIVSGLGREIRAPNGFTIDQVIQTDAPINPGNSGGPLLDDRGRVIGVNSQIATAGSNGNVGIGFAVPSNTVREIVPRLERGETIQRPFLGVSTTDPARGKGAAVAEVTPGGPAARAGLEAGSPLTGQGGDVIVSVDGKPVTAPADVSDHIAAKRPGDRVQVEVLRDGTRRSFEIELGVRPSATSP